MSNHHIKSIKQEIRKNMGLSFPLIASQLLFSSCGFLATVMVAHLGNTDLAATVLVNMIWFGLSTVFLGMISAVSVLVSHQYGAKNYPEIGKILEQSLILAVVIIALIFAVLEAVPALLRLSHQPHNVIVLAMRYVHAMYYWIPALTFISVLQQVLIGLGKTRIVLFASVLLVPLQIAFIYCVMFGKFGLPVVGIAGVGYGIAAADTLGCIALLAYLIYNKKFKKYRLFSRAKSTSRYFRELIRIGFPMGLMTFIEVSAFTMMTFGIARFGTTALAAHQIILQYLGLFITIVFAMSQAITIRVGHAVGAKNKSDIHYAIGVGMGLNFCCMFLLSMVLFFLPHWMIHFDVNIHAANNQALVAAATKLFHVVGFLVLFDNFRIIGFGALRGIKDTKFPMLASFIAFWGVGLSSGFLFGFILHWDSAGIWAGMTLGIACGAIIIIARIIYKLKHLDLDKILDVKSKSESLELQPN
ncbi:MAG: hypothetical protein COB66_06335 [Coxiella sp. (in: Bacteria)]|nr:MAG: hypothetical protein COB66_06335 [Coxiella sp. (in: g-proteobacteria)]